MATTKNYADVIRQKMRDDPDLAKAIEREVALADEEQANYDAAWKDGLHQGLLIGILAGTFGGAIAGIVAWTTAGL